MPDSEKPSSYRPESTSNPLDWPTATYSASLIAWLLVLPRPITSRTTTSSAPAAHRLVQNKRPIANVIQSLFIFLSPKSKILLHCYQATDLLLPLLPISDSFCQYLSPLV